MIVGILLQKGARANNYLLASRKEKQSTLLYTRSTFGGTFPFRSKVKEEVDIPG
jgi:hypothetical protein